MTLTLVGFGTALPEQHMSQHEAAVINASFATDDPKRARTIQALYRRTGVDKRHSVLLIGGSCDPLERQHFFAPAQSNSDRGPTTQARMLRYEQDAPRLAAEAAGRALTDAAVHPDEITHVVTASCTGFFAPGLDAALVEVLRLPSGVERTHVGFMGCHGALNALRVGSAFGRSDPSARVLIASVELCTIHFSYGWDPQSIVANALFSDGAAAVVGVGADRAHGEWSIAASGTFLMPDSADAMTWRIGDHGFRMTLSPSVPEIISEQLAGWLQPWLAEQGLSVDDIGSWAIHPGGPRVLGAARDAIGLDAEAVQLSRDILAEHGNMSSCTVLFILQRLRAAGAALPCVALAFGPGLVVEATLFR